MHIEGHQELSGSYDALAHLGIGRVYFESARADGLGILKTLPVRPKIELQFCRGERLLLRRRPLCLRNNLAQGR